MLRTPSYLEPPVHAIGSTKPMLNLIRPAGLYRVAPMRQDACTIIGMQKQGPLRQFLKSLAEVMQQLLVGAFDFASRSHCPNEAGDRIDDQAQALLILTKGILSALPVVNVSQQHVPAGDAIFSVSRG